MTTNFYAALNMILAVIEKRGLKSEIVENMTLVIFSDMMINQADKNYNSMFDMIQKRYADVVMKILGVPYKPPHILFWNLRQTTGFPNLTTEKNTSMLSGFSPVLLNTFSEKGIDFLQHISPWDMFLEGLNHPRYRLDRFE
jgi:hypothetical protein